MRAFSRLLVICALLVVVSLGLLPGGAVAQGITAQAGPYPMSIDAAHRATTAAIFTPGEQIAFWFNAPYGGAAPFLTSATGAVYAQPDGTLNAVIAPADWNMIPLSATSIVAFGTDSKVNAVYLLTRAPNLDLSLHIDQNHRATTGPIFSPGEQIVFWYNLPNGGAVPFTAVPDAAVYAGSDGSLDVTIPASQWNSLPGDVASLVAHGLYSTVPAVYVFQR